MNHTHSQTAQNIGSEMQKPSSYLLEASTGAFHCQCFMSKNGKASHICCVKSLWSWCVWAWMGVREKRKPQQKERNGDGGCDAGEGHREFSGLSGLPLDKLGCVLGTSGKCSVTDRRSCSLLFRAHLYTRQSSTVAQRCVLNRIRWRSGSLLALTRRRPR